MLSPSLSAHEKASVEINEILIPFNQAGSRLIHFIRPMSFLNDCEYFPISSAGTCFLMKIMGKNFLTSTAHQLKSFETKICPDNICFSPDLNNPQHVVTPTGSIRLTFPGGDVPCLEDIAFFEFESPDYPAALSTAFIDITQYKTLDEIDIASVTHTYALGYLTSDREIQSSEDSENFRVDEYKFKSRRLFLEKLEKSKEFMHHWKSKYDEKIDFDGLSGSPVFFFYKNNENQMHIGFGGIVRTASNGIVQFYDGGAIKAYIAKAIHTPE